MRYYLKRWAPVLVVVLLWTGGAAAQDQVIRVAHVLPVTHPVNLSLLHLSQKVRFQSQGRLALEVVPRAHLGENQSLVEQVKTGLLPMAVTATESLSRLLPRLALTRLPFVFSDRRTFYTFLDTPFRKKLESEAYGQGLVILAWFDLGPRVWLSLGKPLTKPGDFLSTRLHVPDDPLLLETASILGSTAKPGPPSGESRLAQALKNQELDAADLLLDHKALQQCTAGAFLSLSRHVWETALLIANRSFWDNLAPARQQLVLEGAYEAERMNRGYAVTRELEVLQKMRKKGVRLVELDQTNRQAFLRAVYPLYEKWRSRMGADLFDQFLDQVRESRPFL